MSVQPYCFNPLTHTEGSYLIVRECVFVYVTLCLQANVFKRYHDTSEECFSSFHKLLFIYILISSASTFRYS